MTPSLMPRVLLLFTLSTAVVRSEYVTVTLEQFHIHGIQDCHPFKSGDPIRYTAKDCAVDVFLKAKMKRDQGWVASVIWKLPSAEMDNFKCVKKNSNAPKSVECPQFKWNISSSRCFVKFAFHPRRLAKVPCPQQSITDDVDLSVQVFRRSEITHVRDKRPMVDEVITNQLHVVSGQPVTFQLQNVPCDGANFACDSTAGNGATVKFSLVWNQGWLPSPKAFQNNNTASPSLSAEAPQNPEETSFPEGEDLVLKEENKDNNHSSVDTFIPSDHSSVDTSEEPEGELDEELTKEKRALVKNSKSDEQPKATTADRNDPEQQIKSPPKSEIGEELTNGKGEKTLGSENARNSDGTNANETQQATEFETQNQKDQQPLLKIEQTSSIVGEDLKLSSEDHVAKIKDAKEVEEIKNSGQKSFPDIEKGKNSSPLPQGVETVIEHPKKSVDRIDKFSVQDVQKPTNENNDNPKHQSSEDGQDKAKKFKEPDVDPQQGVEKAVQPLGDDDVNKDKTDVDQQQNKENVMQVPKGGAKQAKSHPVPEQENPKSHPVPVLDKPNDQVDVTDSTDELQEPGLQRKGNYDADLQFVPSDSKTEVDKKEQETPDKPKTGLTPAPKRNEAAEIDILNEETGDSEKNKQDAPAAEPTDAPEAPETEESNDQETEVEEKDDENEEKQEDRPANQQNPLDANPDDDNEVEENQAKLGSGIRGAQDAVSGLLSKGRSGYTDGLKAIVRDHYGKDVDDYEPPSEQDIARLGGYRIADY